MTHPIDTSVLARRYDNAYKVARDTVSSGFWVKFFGVVLGLLIALPFAVAGYRIGTDEAILVGIFFGGLLGVIVAVILIRIGIMIAAQGELLRAILDVAVNTSPFLDELGRARIMDLPRQSKTVAGTMFSTEVR